MKVNAGLTKIIVCSTVGFTIAGMAVVESSAIWMTVSNSLPIIHKYTDDLGNWNDVTLTDWMSHIENNKYLSDVSVPGTHDSTTNRLMYERGAEHNIPGVNHPVDLLPFELKTNSYDIVDQLNAGIRLFDLRIAPNPDSPNELILMHASAYCLDEQGNKMKLANVFNIFYSFLKKT